MRRILFYVALCAFPTHYAAGDDAQGSPTMVDLSTQEVSGIQSSDNSHVLSSPWWQNFQLSGFAAAGYYDTGSDGTRAIGGFEIKEASLFIEADVWEDTAFFVEVQTNRLGKDDQLFTRTGEVYIHFRDVPVFANHKVGIKVGRIDIPFGEEYLWQDAPDNSLITNSAAYPYGWDEGVLAYWDTGSWNWIVAVTDGTDERSKEDNSDKAINIKVSRQFSKSLYASISGMRNGDAAKSAIEFGGSHFQPVGASHVSTLGASPNEQVGASMLQVDVEYSFAAFGEREVDIAFFAGYAEQSDSNPNFDRDFRWFSLEPRMSLGPNAYLVARYSEIGTYNANEGFHFDGKTFAGGNGAFGYDTKKFRRVALGVGWKPNPRVTAKFEVGKDWFSLIDASLLANPGNREFVGIEVAVTF